LRRLVEKGNTVVVIEHNLQFIKEADWCVELGPDGGDKGGKIIFTGAPEQLAKANTPTAKFLNNFQFSLNLCARGASAFR